MASSGGTTKVIIIAFFANMGIAVSKFIGAYITGSASLLAEAVHSVVDSSNQLLLLLGNKMATRPASVRYPLGQGREGFFWAFIVAIMLFSLGGLFAIYEGVHKLSSHEPAGSPWVAIGILTFGLILESYSCWACWKEVKIQKGSQTLWRWFKRTTAAELLVIFTEDMAALFGLVIALISVALTMITGDPIYDAIGSILIGFLLVGVAILLAVEIKSLIVGEAPEVDVRPKLEALFSQHLPGAKVLHLIALQTGPSEVMMSCKFHPGSTKEVSGLVAGMNLVESNMKKEFPQLRWQFLEPDFEN